MDAAKREQYRQLLLRLIPPDGSTIGNVTLRLRFKAALDLEGELIGDEDYYVIRGWLIDENLIETGRGRGGSVHRVLDASSDPQGSVEESQERASLYEFPEAPDTDADSEALDASGEEDFHQPDGTSPSTEGADEGHLEVDLGEQTLVAPDKNDRSLAEFHRWKKNGRLIVDPEWQREYVWDAKRASRLIESLLIDLPIPVIYLALDKEGRYEVIDGLQRLTSIFRFFDGEYALKDLEIRRELNGLKFAQLPESRQHKLEDSTLRTFELPARTDKDLMFLIFERLNTGGIALTDMEIRNCLYRGTLNQLIKKLARLPEFRASVNQKNIEVRMADRMLVLRFLAFYQMTYKKARRGLKKFINEFFETYKNPPEEKLNEFESVFRKAMKASHTIFGDQGFRLRRAGRNSSSRGGEWGSRMNAAIFQAIAVSFTDFDLGALTRSSDAIFEEYLDLIATDQRWADCVSATTSDFPRIEYAFETWSDRLKKVMALTEPNDKDRLFTRELKNELFDQNPTCRICGQSIRLINDAALDHDIHYWRGGRTVPENARLVHRQYNLERSHG